MNDRVAVALGLFDGIHDGHKLILNKAVGYSEMGLQPAVFTFNPESVSTKHGKPFKYIYTNPQKLEIIQDLGIEYIESYNFDDIKDYDGEFFAKEILVNKMKAEVVICGENFRFGREALCDTVKLKEFGQKYGFKVEIIKLAPSKNGGVLSSQVIRNMLRDGKSEKLVDLGFQYFINAEVVSGNKLGRTLNFPTINQNFGNGQLVPRKGVYRSSVNIRGVDYNSVTNIGIKPTVEKDIRPIAETHILNYSGNLYGRKLKLNIYEFIRDEMKFSSIDELKKQIAKDVEYIERKIK